MVICLLYGYMVFRGYMTFPWLYGSFAWLYSFSRGYIILRGYTTFAWLYASLPWLFSSFYVFIWFSVVI